jgi:hypothetical protein
MHADVPNLRPLHGHRFASNSAAARLAVRADPA